MRLRRIWILAALVCAVSAIGSAAVVNRSGVPARTTEGTGVVGTWRLVSVKRTVMATGETTDIMGASPLGFINYSPDGRMMMIFVSETRPRVASVEAMTDGQRAELLKTMVAYAGTYEKTATTIVHQIDVSWNEVWTGTNQLRHYRLDGDRLTLTTDAQANSIDGKISTSALKFERVK